MAKHQAEREVIMLLDVRAASMQLFTASAYEKDKDPEYFLRVLINKDDKQVAAIRKTITELYRRAWPTDAEVAYKKAKAANRVLLHDGDEQADKDGFDETVVYFNASSKDRPTVVNRKRKAVAEEDGLFYPGCYVNVKIQIYTWENVKGRGVGCDLLGVQFARNGEALETGGGGASASPEDFPEMDDEDEAGSDWAGGDSEEDDDDSWN